MSFLVVSGVLLTLIIFLLVILSWVWPPDSPWAPWWRTNKEVARAFCELAEIRKGDVVYELGSGDAQALITAAKEYGAKGVGVEIDPLRVFVSNMLLYSSGVSDKITIKRKNFFDEDLSKATVVFVYLVPKTLNRLKPKFLKELKKGTRVVSYRYEINLPERKYDKKHDLRLYII